MYDAKETRETKKQVTEYLVQNHFKDCGGSHVVLLPSESPLDIPLLYQHGKVNRSTVLDCIYDPFKSHLLGSTKNKSLYYDVHLKRTLKREIKDTEFIDNCIKSHYCDIRDYCPTDLNIRCMYIDTCNLYETGFGEWLAKIDSCLENDARVIFNFVFKGEPTNVNNWSDEMDCAFRLVNISEDLGKSRKREIAVAMNDLLKTVNTIIKDSKYVPVEAISYKGDKTMSMRMGVIVLKKQSDNKGVDYGMLQ